MSKLDLHDSFVIDGVRKTGDGYLTAFAKVARTGIQVYRGHELGRPDLAQVRVYRPPEEVFSADAMHSFAHRPVTLRHPPVPVNAKNWRKFAGGQTGEEVVRDGDFVKVPMVLMDSAIIDAYEKEGIKELSMGYSTDIKWQTGVTDGGEHYDAVQTAIRGNHLALVPVARGGDQLRIGDEDLEDAWSDEARAAALAARKSRAGEKKSRELLPSGYPKRSLKEIGQSNARNFHEEGVTEEMMRARMQKEGYTKAEQDEAAYHYRERMKKPPARRPSHSADAGTCPECGAEMQGKTCPECNYVKDGEENMKTLMLDGLSVSVADDQSASIIQRVVDGLTTQLKQANDALEDLKKKKADADKEVTDAKTLVSAKDGEIVVLKKQVADAEITPAKLDVLVKDRLSVIDSAKSLLPKEFAFDGKTLADIRRAAVAAKLGDEAVKAMDDAAVGGAFAALSASAVDTGGSRPIADAFASRPHGAITRTTTADAAYEGYRKNLEGAWKNPSGAAA